MESFAESAEVPVCSALDCDKPIEGDCLKCNDRGCADHLDYIESQGADFCHDCVKEWVDSWFSCKEKK
ncbi:MAG: hypothetical protein HN472_09230 [Nitrospina sp.]|jgi:hypothetical protein|nr:hypothetical protein [Nitrospina sp.]